MQRTTFVAAVGTGCGALTRPVEGCAPQQKQQQKRPTATGRVERPETGNSKNTSKDAAAAAPENKACTIPCAPDMVTTNRGKPKNGAPD